MSSEWKPCGICAAVVFASLTLVEPGLARVQETYEGGTAPQQHAVEERTDAPDTRAAHIAARQREKAQALASYRPTRFERVMARIEESFTSPASGFYPTVGSVYRGGGFTPGVGYRRFYGRDAVWSAVGLYSVENYKGIELGNRTPWHGRGRRTVSARAGWLDAPDVAYFGRGMDRDARRTAFRLTQFYGGVSATLRPQPWTRLEGGMAMEAYRTEEGRGAHPSIETIHTSSTAPGLFAEPTFLRAEASAAIDWRTSPGYSRRGGLYAVTLTGFTDAKKTYSFRRLDGEIVQHIPLLRETWVVSLRGRVQTTMDEDDVVPFFLLPELGSGRTLRAYESGRFRDRHSVLTSAEFRWTPNRTALDMALFVDAGKVTSGRQHLDFRDLTSDWGIGARFHGPTATVLRIEAARGRAGWRLVMGTTAPF